MNITHLLPVRNGMKYLPQIEDSILCSVRTGDELIIVENGSIDGTADYLRDLEKLDSRIRVLNLLRGGLIESLNLGLQEASNDWIARCDIDDQYCRERIESQTKLISERSVAVFSDALIIDDYGNEISRVYSPIFPIATGVSLIRNRRTPHSSALINRHAAISVGAYVKEHRFVEDLSLWLRLVRVGDLVSSPIPLMKYRIHGQSVTSASRKSMKEARRNLLSAIGLPKEIFKELEEKSTRHFLAKYENLSYPVERAISFVAERYLLQGCNVSARDGVLDEDFLAVISHFGLLQSIASAKNLIKNESRRIAARRHSIVPTRS